MRRAKRITYATTTHGLELLAGRLGALALVVQASVVLNQIDDLACTLAHCDLNKPPQ
jgi:hypothetical protein